MVALDSYKLSCDIGSVLDLNTDRMMESEHRLPVEKDGFINSDPVRIRQYSVVNPCTGIKKITVDERKGKVLLEGSAKILQEQYREGITVNTFERVVDGYNGTGIIKLDPARIMETGELFTVDVSKNMQMEHPIPEYIEALHRLHCNNRYQVEQFKNDGNSWNGITFKGKQRTFSERMIFYDKQKDVARDKSFRKYAGEYAGILRSETNFKQKRRTQKYFGSNRLQDVLNSPVNVNLLLFEKVYSRASNDLLRLFDETEGMKLYEIEKRIGRETIIRDYCQMDFDLIEEFVRHRIRGNPSRYLNEYRELLSAMSMTNVRTVEFVEKHIQEIRLKLAS